MFQFIILGVFILFLLCTLRFTENFGLIEIKSLYNNNTYKVRNDYNNVNDASIMMSKIRSNIDKLLMYLEKKYPVDIRVIRLIRNFNANNLMEAEYNESSNTSYTINKGEEVHICLRNKSEYHELHDLNTLMFVTLHELAHIMSESVGHNTEFNDNFVFILKEACVLEVYTFVDYSEHPVEYCGMIIDRTPIKN